MTSVLASGPQYYRESISSEVVRLLQYYVLNLPLDVSEKMSVDQRQPVYGVTYAYIGLEVCRFVGWMMQFHGCRPTRTRKLSPGGYDNTRQVPGSGSEHCYREEGKKWIQKFSRKGFFQKGALDGTRSNLRTPCAPMSEKLKTQTSRITENAF